MRLIVNYIRLRYPHSPIPTTGPYYLCSIQYPMGKYIAISEDFTDYLYERRRELVLEQGMSQIEVINANYGTLQVMKEELCLLRGANSTEINTRWAILKGITDYTIKHLGFVPKEVKWE